MNNGLLIAPSFIQYSSKLDRDLLIYKSNEVIIKLIGNTKEIKSDNVFLIKLFEKHIEFVDALNVIEEAEDLPRVIIEVSVEHPDEKMMLNSLITSIYLDLKETYNVNVEINCEFHPTISYKKDNEVLNVVANTFIKFNMSYERKGDSKDNFVDEKTEFIIIKKGTKSKLSSQDEMADSHEGSLFSIVSKINPTLRKNLLASNILFLDEDGIYVLRRNIAVSDFKMLNSLFDLSEKELDYLSEQKKLIEFSRDNKQSPILEFPVYYKNNFNGTVISFDGEVLTIEKGKCANKNSDAMKNKSSYLKERVKKRRELLANGFISEDGTFIRRYSVYSFQEIASILEGKTKFRTDRYKESGGKYRNLADDKDFIESVLK